MAEFPTSNLTVGDYFGELSTTEAINVNFVSVCNHNLYLLLNRDAADIATMTG